MLWSAAGMKGDHWYRGVVAAAGNLITRCHRDGAERRWLRRPVGDAKKSGVKEKEGGGGGSGTDAVASDCKNKEMADLVSLLHSLGAWKLPY